MVDWLKRNKDVFLDSKNRVHLRRDGNYFYQVQMQLDCCDLDLRFFILYFDKGDIHVEKINPDIKNLATQNIAKLIDFILKLCYLKLWTEE